MISKVLRDFPLGQNQPLKSTDDQYIIILKNVLKKLKKNKKIGHGDWVVDHAVFFVCI
jgi:hypothetical protein